MQSAPPLARWSHPLDPPLTKLFKVKIPLCVTGNNLQLENSPKAFKTATVYTLLKNTTQTETGLAIIGLAVISLSLVKFKVTFYYYSFL